MLQTPDPEVHFDCPSCSQLDKAVGPRRNRCRNCEGKGRLALSFGHRDQLLIGASREAKQSPSHEPNVQRL